jgi:pimeloyl-ACP methyl ester carboxylesterase
MFENTHRPAVAVILPTLWSGPWVWRNQLDLLSRYVPRVVEIDGAVVNWPIDPTLDAAEQYCLEKMADCPSPVLLVGASVGGLLALRIAAHRPELVSAVIASGCPGLGTGGGISPPSSFTLSFEEACEARSLVIRNTHLIDDELLRKTVDEVSNRPAIRRGVRLLRELSGYDVAAQVRELAVSTTLIWGEDDRLSPLAPWRELVRECPVITLEVIAAAGHIPMLDEPVKFNEILDGALQRLDGIRKPKGEPR